MSKTPSETTLSPKKAKRFQKIFDLQFLLLNICENNYDELKDLVHQHFTKSPEVVEFLAHEIVTAVNSRYENSPLYARLMASICKTIRPNTNLSFFKPAFWSDFKRLETKNYNFFFIHQCFLAKAFTIHEIIEQIQNWPFAHETNTAFDFFMYFAPDLNFLELETYFQIFTDITNKHSYTKQQKPLYDDWDELRENRYEKLIHLLDDGCSKGTLKYDLKYDNIDHFRTLCSEKTFNPDDIVPTFQYDPPLLRNDPKLIHYCAYYGSVRCFRHLMHKGADVHSVDNEGLNILDFALIGGNSKIIGSVTKHARSIRPTLWFLIKYHLNDSFNIFYQSSKLTENNIFEAFHLCIKHNNLSLINALINYGISINHIGSGGYSPLMDAVENQQPAIVKIFINFHGVDFNIVNEAGNSCLHLACETGNLIITKMIVEKTGDLLINLPTKYSQDIPLHIAAEIGHIGMIHYLLQKSPESLNTKNFENATPLMAAVKAQQLESVMALLSQEGIETDTQDKKGRTALHIAIELENEEIAEEIVNINPGLVNVADEYGQTPLHVAAELNIYELVKLLLKIKDVDLTIVDSDGKTPPEYAKSRSIHELFKYTAERQEKRKSEEQKSV